MGTVLPADTVLPAAGEPSAECAAPQPSGGGGHPVGGESAHGDNGAFPGTGTSPDAALAGGLGGSAALRPLLAETLRALEHGARARGGPLPSGGPAAVAARLAHLLRPQSLLPERGDPDTLPELVEALAATAADPADPACAAHLHCPPLAVAAAADLAASALNPSLDSWDQAPGAADVETAVIRALAGLVGFPEPGAARGVLTSGGTESNLMALLLARDAVLREEYGVPPGDGIPAAAAGRLRVFCSTAAHFSLARAAAQLGFGSRAVVRVPCDDRGRMDPAALDRALTGTRSEGNTPVCVAATAGTTDLGAIDPLPAVARTARAHGVRLHVDAAYGGGALFSRRLAPLLDGLPSADTVGLDLHKIGWQPIPAGVFLSRSAAAFQPLEQRAAYLNPADDEDAGYPSLLGRSLRTTRRADAFKLAVTLRTLGRAGLGAITDHCHLLARSAAARIDADPRLELTAPPVLTTVVFRYLPLGAAERSVPPVSAGSGHAVHGDRQLRTGGRCAAAGGSGVPAAGGSCCPAPEFADRVNAGLRRRLLAAGRAVVGRTEIGTGPGSVRLKLTLLNPQATEEDVAALLDAVVRAGAAESAEAAPTRDP